RSALLATLLSVAALGLSVGFPATAAAQETSMQDLERLKTLPLIEVIRSGIAVYTVNLTRPHEPYPRLGGRTPLAAVEDMDPELRCLPWLMFFAERWIFPDQTDHLHTFIFWESGDFATQVRDALQQAGLSAQHQVLAEAIASFGPSYPVGYDERKARS